jgi:hypothetical protein
MGRKSFAQNWETGAVGDGVQHDAGGRCIGAAYRGKASVMTENRPAVACPSCAASPPPGSDFCPRCGTRLTGGETLELHPDPIVPDPALERAAPEDSPHSFHQVHRRPFGLDPVSLLAALGGVSLLAAIVLLANGSLVAGLILLGVAITSSTLFVGGARRDPSAPAARRTLRAVARIRSFVGMLAVRTRAWVLAAFRLLRIRMRQRRLGRELRAILASLGEAVHRDEEQRIRSLKQRAAEIEQELADARRESSAAIEAARGAIERERASVEPTQPLSTVPAERAEPSLRPADTGKAETAYAAASSRREETLAETRRRARVGLPAWPFELP